MRFLVGVASAFGAGGLIGVGLGIILTEEKYRREYQESTRSFMNVMKMARTPSSTVVEAPKETEDELLDDFDIDFNQVAVSREVIQFDATKTNFVPADTNPYHTAISAEETDVDLFVSSGVNKYGVSYIEEEEYEEEDGRDKLQITIVMDEHNPIFIMEGAEIRDWDERIGDSILVDFYKHVPPGASPVLYVRNHKTDEDYEVVREQP